MWRSDGQTDRFTIANTALSIASYAKRCKNLLHQFPVASWRLPCCVANKSATIWRGEKVRYVCCVVSFPHSITTTCWQQVGNFPVYGKLRGNVSNGFWALDGCVWVCVCHLAIHNISFIRVAPPSCIVSSSCNSSSSSSSHELVKYWVQLKL